MLTKNGKTILLAKAADKTPFLKATDGTINSVAATYGSYIFMSGYAYVFDGNYYTKRCYCVLGNGTTQESEENYNMASQITNLKNDSFVLTPVFTEDVSKLCYRAVYTNNTSEPITVSEVGLLVCYGSPVKNYLVYRKTFDPITLAPNDTYTFAIDLI